jgi:hypothetical protein
MVALSVGLVGTLVGLHTIGGAAANARSASPPKVDYLYLTIAINPVNGDPQYSPANFSVPRGEVQVIINNYDAGEPWLGCACTVTGTAGNLEYVNGTPAHTIDPQAVSHTFTIPSLGLNVVLPPTSVVTFTLWANQTGTYQWLCMMPCGAGDDPSSSPPMGDAGWMAGALTVT